MPKKRAKRAPRKKPPTKPATPGELNRGRAVMPGKAPPEFLEFLRTMDPSLRGSWKVLMPQVVDAIVGAVAAGGTIKIAAGYVGQTEQQVYEWLKQGQEDLERGARAWADGREPEPQSECARLLRECCAAQAFWGGSLLAVVQADAYSKSPSAVASAKWLLARVGPKIASPRIEVDDWGDMGGQVGEGRGDGEDRRKRMLEQMAETWARVEALNTGAREAEED